MFREFRKFAVQGNVVDLAIGIIIGSAFGSVVSSLVEDIFMPPIGLLLNGVDFTNIFILLKEGSSPKPYPSLAIAEEMGAVTLNIGVFINTLISFLIVAFVVFILVRTINRIREEKDSQPEPITTKSCPFCTVEIPIKAVRCPECTSQLS